MKLLMTVLCVLSVASAQAADNSAVVQDQLRAECAKSYVEYGGKYAGAQHYDASYAKEAGGGYYRYGERSYRACSEAQYSAYLEKADPAKVMAAYPTAAGRPGYKKDTKPDDKTPVKPDYKPDYKPESGK
jgi:hypothetical protein